MNGLPLILHESRFDDATPVASSTAAGDYHVLNVRDWRNFTWWKPSAVPANVTVDCGGDEAADYLLVYGEAGTYEARSSTDNFSANDTLRGTVTLTQAGLGLAVFTSAAARYWRLNIPSGAAPAVAIAAIGRKLEFPRRLRQPFDALAHAARGEVRDSEEGNPLGAVDAYDEWSQTIELHSIDRSWVTGTWRPAWLAHLKNEPSVFAWDPDDHATELYHVKPIREYAAPSRHGNFVNFGAVLRGKVEW